MPKYPFSLSRPLKEYIEWRLEHYHEDVKQLEIFKADMLPKITVNYSRSMAHTNTTSDPTADSGIRLATSAYILETERGINAIKRTLDNCDDTDRKLVDLVYWKRTYTVTGAAAKISLSSAGAYKRINKILCSVALELGYVNI